MFSYTGALDALQNLW